jgi:hypothetical protein
MHVVEEITVGRREAHSRKLVRLPSPHALTGTPMAVGEEPNGVQNPGESTNGLSPRGSGAVAECQTGGRSTIVSGAAPSSMLDPTA